MPALYCAVINISEQDINSSIKDHVIIQVNIKHSNTPYSIFATLKFGVF